MSLPRIQTPRLVLRCPEPADASRMQQYAGDERVAASTLNIPHPYTRQDALDFITYARRAMQREEHFNFAIVRAADDAFMGIIGLTQYREHRSAELGYWLGVPHWNAGYTTEAAHAALAYAFQTLQLNRVYAMFFVDNPASGRVLEKVGMQREGTLVQHFWRWDAPKDVGVFGLLAVDYRPDAP